MLRRFITLLVVVCTLVYLLVTVSNRQWRPLKQVGSGGHHGLGENSRSGNDEEHAITSGRIETIEGFNEINPHAWKDGREGGQFKEPKVYANSPYPVGKTKIVGSNYSRTLVIAKLQEDNTTWIDEALRDMLKSGLLSTAIYVMDDPTSPLHPTQNKGHEVMAYLDYIINSYDKLSDVCIFMHAHRYTWHNNIILDKDASQMIRHLSPERVTREGYMNLRCHWDPGCPDWLHPGQTDQEKKEQQVFAASWSELFPGEAIPVRLAQPCCGQFAVSRERIHAIPKERFVFLRDWLLHTDLDDFLSGRIFEYTWQYIFTSSPLHCPSMSACYCDGYGLCFGDAEKFDFYFELLHHLNEYEFRLERWNAKGEKITSALAQAKDGRFNGAESLEIPEAGLDSQLKEEIDKLKTETQQRKEDAFERGRDPAQRAKEAGREWKEGDGF